MKSKKEIASEILKKYEDKNERHFKDEDREWILEAMLEFKKKFVPKVLDLRGPSVRTGASWLIKLPKEVQDMWEEEAIKCIGKEPTFTLLDNKCSFRTLIDSAFAWEETPQGAEFWINISKGKYVPLQ